MTDQETLPQGTDSQSGRGYTDVSGEDGEHPYALKLTSCVDSQVGTKRKECTRLQEMKERVYQYLLHEPTTSFRHAFLCERTRAEFRPESHI
jgi:hypothetical protein